MKGKDLMKRRIFPFLWVGSILFGLYITSLYSYLLFHSLAEMFSIIIACAIFMIAWNSRRFLEHDYLLFIGIAYLFVGGLDLVHTLSYKGMGVFPGTDANFPTQLWIAARYLQSISLLLAPLWIRRKLRVNSMLLACGMVVALLLWAIFSSQVFPDCFIEGQGLTPFKKISEYIISFMLGTAIILLLPWRKEFDPAVFHLLIGAILASIVAELAFTLYVSVYGFFNLLGHLLKVVAFYLTYKALIETGLVRPYDLLFRNLKNSEEALRLSEEKFSKAFRSSPNPKTISSLADGRYIEVNDSFLQLTGYAREEVVGHAALDLNIWVRPEEHTRLKEMLQSEGVIRNLECSFRTKGGEIRVVLLAEEILEINEGPCIIGVINDITERKKMEEELRRTRDELDIRVQERTFELAKSNEALQVKIAEQKEVESRLRNLSSQLLTVQENERKRIARELHDSIGQSLAATKFVLEKKLSQLDIRLAPQGVTLEEVIPMIQNTIEESRRIAMDLWPSVLDDLGILSAIGWLCRQFGIVYSAIAIEKQLDIKEHEIPTPLKVVIYRVLQETLNNVAKHSRADRVYITLWKQDGKIELTIEDNGIGFHPETSGKGLGLVSMKERVEFSGGKLAIESASHLGTTIRAIWPIA
jgi:PAS domain S-box-containing protein